MKSIDRLVAEHVTIKRALDLVERAVARIGGGLPVPDGFPKWAPEFFSEFADKCHHAKEEDLLFPLLKERGIPEEGGPIGVMLREHVLGRDCVRRMREAAEGTLDPAAFLAAGGEYVPLLRQHIDKEDNILFRMAANCMSAADDAELDARFTQVEQQKGFVGLHQRCEAEVAGWKETFG